MKKTSPSFTFEVKRSKLPSQQPSRFERFVLEPKQKLSVPKRDAADQEFSDASRTEVPVVQRRILESLPIAPAMPKIEMPVEPQVKAPALEEVAAPVNKRRYMAVAAPPTIEGEAEEATEPPMTEERIIPAEAAVVVPFTASKSKHKSALSVDHLPRGERWKRRLPRSAW